MTDIEEAVSKILSKMGFTYHEQYEMYPYIVDFYLPEFKIVVEADGSVWHNQMKDKKRDKGLMEKYQVRVLHFSDTVIMKHPEYVERTIRNEIELTTYRRD